jgi:hypothetical protein
MHQLLEKAVQERFGCKACQRRDGIADTLHLLGISVVRRRRSFLVQVHTIFPVILSLASWALVRRTDNLEHDWKEFHGGGIYRVRVATISLGDANGALVFDRIDKGRDTTTNQCLSGRKKIG